MKKLALVSLMIAMATFAGVAAGAANGVDIGWSVLAGGGGRAGSGTLSLDNTAGQAAAGLASGGTTQLCTGFWCQNQARQAVYLPLLLRS